MSKKMFGQVVFRCSLTGVGMLLDRYGKEYSFKSTESLLPEDSVQFVTSRRGEATNVVKAAPGHELRSIWSRS